MRLTWRRGCYVVLILLSLLAVFVAYKVGRIGSLALSLKGRLDRLQTLQPEQVKPQSLGSLVGEVRAARSELQVLRSELSPLLAIAPSTLGWLPRYGNDIKVAPALMDMTAELSDAGDVMLTSLEPKLALLSEGNLSISDMVQIIQDIQPALSQARPHLDRAIEARARVSGPLSPRLAQLLAKVDKALPLAVTAADAAALAPDLLGLDGPRTYLVLAQNSDELRPTGGFISSVGRMVVERGQIVSQAFEDSYTVDDYRFSYPDSPIELQTYMGAEIWVFRDSNWSPDFPISARDAIRLYQISRPGPVDGVIVVNLRAIPALFEGLGPVTVPGFEQPVTSQTVVAIMRQAVLPEPEEREQDWWEHRKDFMGQLAGAVLARIQSGLTAEQALQLVRASLEILERRDILIYLESPEAQRLLAQRKWDGAMVQPVSDFLMVVDANMGFNKVNPKIDEQLAYTVQLNELGAGRASLEISHTSRARPEQRECDPTPRYDPSYEGMMNRCYWDFVRVYAPAGSTLITATVQAPAPLVGDRFSDGRPIIIDHPTYAIFGSFFALKGGMSQVTRFEYGLPKVTVEENGAQKYSLYIQRQPAASNWPLEVTLTLPDGAEVIKADPPAKISGQKLQWSLRLSVDREVQVWYRLQ